MTSRFKVTTSALVLGAMAIVAGPAQAEDDAATVDDGAPAGEIVVTAQKREQRLIDVPAAITALGSEQIDAARATQISDFAAYVPGLDIGSAGAPGQTRLTLRGIGLGSSTATVGTYINDTPLGSSAGWQRASSHALDLMPYDIERIEVLRGPQGTLYGANAMGGLLKYVLRQPNLGEFEGRAGIEIRDLSHADDPIWGLRASVNVPIVEGQLAMRVSGFHQDQPGYIDNAITGERATNAVEQSGGRIALLWEAAPNVSVKLSALLQDTDSEGSSVVALTPDDATPINGKYETNRRLAQPFSQSLRYYAGTVEWDLGAVNLVSATSYSSTDTYEISDESATIAPLVPIFTGGEVTEADAYFLLDLDLKKFTQELRLASAAGSAFQWTAGLFYTHEKGANYQEVNAQAPDGTPLTGLYPTDEGLESIGRLVVANTPTTYRETALFANASYDIGAGFEVGGGIRYAENRQKYRAETSGFLLGNGVTLNESKEDVFNYAANIQYSVTDRAMLYARVASGYRPGGPNAPLPNIPATVQSDSLTSYELGFKGDLFDRAVNFDLAIYRIDWKDVQIAMLNTDTGASYLGNGGAARSEGVEVAAQINPVRGFRIGLTGAYTDPKLREDLPPSRNLVGVKGDSLPGAARWTFAGTADYRYPLSDDWDVNLGAAFRHVGKRWSTVSGDPSALRIPSYQTVDVTLGLSSTEWDVSLFIRNLTDSYGFLSQSPIVSALGPRVRIDGAVIQPRTVGISIDRRF